MAGVKISALPAIVTPALTDVFPVVQAGVTYKETITQLGTLLLLLGGGTMTGNLILNADPTTALQAATKQYVDAVATGLNVQPSCLCASTAALTVTYNNGASGVGATLTNAGAMAAFSVDGVSPTVGQRVLIKDQASALQNGIYTVTTVGSGAVNWVLTRATDFDTPAEIQPGDFVLVLSGTINAQTQWVQTATVATVGTDSIVWNQFGADINVVITAIQNNSYVYCEDTGAADAYVATPSPAITAYVEGQVFILDPDNANLTATPTINVSGLGVKTITNDQGGALVAGDIIASKRIYLLYDGTNFRLVNRNYEKRIQNDSFNYILDTGAADAYVATLVPAVTSYVAGQRLSLKIANANLTTTPTVNVNALGAKTIVHTNGAALVAGDLPAGMIADLRYDGTNYQLLNPVKLISRVVTQEITSTGTYTPTTGMMFCIVEIVGGGGGGGGVAFNVSNNCAAGGGGGGYARKLYNAVEIGANAAVTIGAAGAGGAAGNNNGTAGGNSDFNPAGTGATITANGGGGGTGNGTNWTAAAITGQGGAGGTATNGDVNKPGTPGEPGKLLGIAAASQIWGGGGGHSFFGSGVAGAFAAGAGAAGVGFGAGGSGGASTGADTAGGAGIIGVCRVTEFCNP